jgi:hypothetical protein
MRRSVYLFYMCLLLAASACARPAPEQAKAKESADVRTASVSGESDPASGPAAAASPKDPSPTASKGGPSEASKACRAYPDRKGCEADAKCGGIPYWGESLVACIFDARGFSNNCPYVGCKAAEVSCPGKAAFFSSCSKACPGDNYALDENGCRKCECGK